MNSFWDWWQDLPQKVDPVLFEIGRIQIRWYSIMYLVAFAVTYLLIRYRIKKEHFKSATKDDFIDLFLWSFIAVVIGGRLGYVLFYNTEMIWKEPLEILLPFDFSNGSKFVGLTGMSFHGGVIGIVITDAIFCIRRKLNFWKIADFIAPAIPLGYTFGRIGNFMNGELFGRTTTSKIGMHFKLAFDEGLRHPSQLYEAFFEGIFLFAVLWGLRTYLLKRKKAQQKNKKDEITVAPFEGFFISLYLIGYGLVRFFIEFYREPDGNLGFVLWKFTMGQILCFGMIIIGLVIFFIKNRALNKKALNNEKEN